MAAVAISARDLVALPKVDRLIPVAHRFQRSDGTESRVSPTAMSKALSAVLPLRTSGRFSTRSTWLPLAGLT